MGLNSNLVLRLLYINNLRHKTLKTTVKKCGTIKIQYYSPNKNKRRIVGAHNQIMHYVTLYHQLHYLSK